MGLGPSACLDCKCLIEFTQTAVTSRNSKGYPIGVAGFWSCPKCKKVERKGLNSTYVFNFDQEDQDRMLERSK